MGGVHQVAQVDRLQVVGDRPVHERQGDGEVAADQHPGRADHFQRPAGIELQQAHRGDDRRHREGQQDEHVHHAVQAREVVVDDEHQRQDQQHAERQGAEADQQRAGEGQQEALVAPQRQVPLQGQAVRQQGRRPLGGQRVEQGRRQRQDQDQEQRADHQAMVERGRTSISARHGSSCAAAIGGPG